MYLLQLAQFFGHLVGALLLLALFSHRTVTSLSVCATRASVRPQLRYGQGHRGRAVRPPETLPQRGGALPSPASPRLSRAILANQAERKVGTSTIVHYRQRVT